MGYVGPCPPPFGLPWRRHSTTTMMTAQTTNAGTRTMYCQDQPFGALTHI